MNNLLDFEEYILESKKISKIEIDRSEGDKITITPADNDLDTDDKRRLFNILSSNRDIIIKVTGKRDKLESKINFENIKKFISLCAYETNIFSPKHDSGYIKLKNDNEEIMSLLNNIFAIDEHGIGKGEVLLSSFYNNVYKSSSIDTGDCYYTVNNGEKHIPIEVKTGGSSFPSLSIYLQTLSKQTDLQKEIEKFKKETESDKHNIPNFFINHIHNGHESEKEYFNKLDNKEQYILEDCIGGLTCYIWYERNRLLKKKKEDLCIIFYDNTFKGDSKNAGKEIEGYLYINIKKEDNLKTIYNKLIETIHKDIHKDSKSGVGKFTISIINGKIKFFHKHSIDKITDEDIEKLKEIIEKESE